jgi:hypothetical protein
MMWSMILSPHSVVGFGNLMFEAIASQKTIRNGHVLARMTSTTTFVELDSLFSIRAANAVSNSTRFISKQQKQKVIKPSLYNAGPANVRELVKTPQYSAVSSSFGSQPQAPRGKTRMKNVGLSYESLSLIDVYGVETQLSEEDVAELTKKIASLKETLGLVSNGLDKVGNRLYSTHRYICGGVNGDMLKYFKGLSRILMNIDEFFILVVGFQTFWKGSLQEMADHEVKVSVANFFEVVCLVKKTTGVKSVASSNDEPDLIPVFSKLGPRPGSLNQAFPLAASEQYLLDPAKVLIMSNFSFYCFFMIRIGKSRGF